MAALRRGRQIEQWLGTERLADGTWALRWMAAYQAGDSFKLVLHRVRDARARDSFDVAAFPPVDDEEEFGEGAQVAEDSDPERLLDKAVSHGAKIDRWVNQAVVQDEYRDSRGGRSTGS